MTWLMAPAYSTLILRGITTTLQVPRRNRKQNEPTYGLTPFPALGCARELAVVALGGAVKMDWDEVLRVAGLPEYDSVSQCKALVREVADELKVNYPFDSD